MILLVPAGCISISRTRVIPQNQRLLPAKTATKEELLKGLEEKSKEVHTLKGTVTMDVSGGGSQSGLLTEYRQTTGYVLVDRPVNIRIKVLAPIVASTVFDMVSDGRQYRVSIPVKNQFAVGDIGTPINSKSPIANLRPQHLLDGLFVDISPYVDKPEVKYSFSEQIEGQRSYYVFTFIDASAEGREVRTLEKLWIDRNDDLEVSRKQMFTPDGRIETDVQYSNYHSEGNMRFPEIVVIQRPIEDYTLKITFQKTTLNDKLPDNAFYLERPEGSELVQQAH
jgi:outer membrane lipoprotein-sorting protein